jgi:hypothetical protein
LIAVLIAVYELQFNEAMNKVKTVNSLLDALGNMGDISNTKELEYKLEQVIRDHCKDNKISLNNIVDSHHQMEYDSFNTGDDNLFENMLESAQNGNPYCAMDLYNGKDHDENT